MTTASPSPSPAFQRTAALRARRQGRPWPLALVLRSEPRVSDKGLRALETHRYQAGKVTPLDDLLYAIWWGPVARRLPLWLAPNAITATGAAAVVAAGSLLWGCSPSLDGGVPSWALLVACVLLLFYMTCDAVDGMQARSTGAASPLGELFDHGCDCVCVTFLGLGFCVTMQVGLGWLPYMVMCLSWLPWFLAQWESLHTGIVRTSTAAFGVTETELAIVLVHAVTAIAGPEVWSTMIAGHELRTLVIGIQVPMSMFFTVFNVISVLQATSSVSQSCRRAWPVVVLIGVAGSWPFMTPLLRSPVPLVWFAALFTRIASEVVVSHMTKEEYPKAQPSLWLLFLVIPLALVGFLDGLLGKVFMLLYAVYCVVDALAYMADAVEEIATHLGVSIFLVRPRKKM